MQTAKLKYRGVEYNYIVGEDGSIYSLKRNKYIKPIRTGARRTSAQVSKIRLSTAPRIDALVGEVVLESFGSPRPTGSVLMHLDDNTENNALTNISWGTPKDNALDSALKKRGGGQKLGVDDVKNILAHKQNGIKNVAIARMFGVSTQRVCDIVNGRSAIRRAIEIDTQRC